MLRLRSKDLVSIADLSREEIIALIRHSIAMKNAVFRRKPLRGKTLAMIFSKSSTRTRVSFETGMRQIGGHALFLSDNDLQIGRGETIEDTARVLSRYVDGIVIRTFLQTDVEALARSATIPVINGLTDDEHPCQILADLQTIYEHKRTFAVKIAYVGDGNNVAASLALACEIIGIECVIATPKGFELPVKIRMKTPSVKYVTDPRDGVKDADIVYTDVWTSMGQERERSKRRRIFAPYQVNEALVSLCRKDYLFMHCLPAHRGEEVSAGVIDGPHSVVFDEAENRLHMQKAILTALLR